MKKTLLTRIGTTIFIAVGVLAVNDLWESEFKNEHASANKTDGNTLKVNVDNVLKKQYNELVYNATGEKSYLAVMETVNKKIEEEKVRRAEEERKAELEEQKRIETEKAKQAEKAKQVQSTGGTNLGTFNVSFYTARCTGCTGTTATGVNVSNTTMYQGYGVVASDWNVLPPYSIIEVEGYGQFIVLDKGGAIKNRKLDILVATKEQAYKNGRQNLNVKVIRWGK